MAKFLNAVLFTPTAGGTADFTVSAAVQGYQTPNVAGALNGALYRYRAESITLNEWEIGYGTYNTGTGVLTRAVVIANSLGTTAKINFAAAPNVGMGMPFVTDIFSTKNYIVNGAMMVSQENGATAGAASGYYPVDQFSVNFVMGGSISAAQVASVTPSGSPNRLRVTVTSVDAAIVAGDLLVVETCIEGNRVADLRSGSSAAKTVTLQFGIKAPAGTYAVGVRNAAPNRSYVSEFVISAGEANTDVVKSVTLQLDQAGTWLTDTGIGFIIDWTLMAGSNFQATANTWNAASGGISTVNVSNFMDTNGNVFELFDVGLYEGSIAPEFVVPNFADEAIACKRYFYKGTPPARGLCSSASSISRVGCQHPVPMRASPAIAVNGNVGVTDGAVGQTIGSVTTNYSDADKFEIDATTAGATLTANRVAMLFTSTGALSINARL